MKRHISLLFLLILCQVLLLPSHRIAADVVANDSFEYPNGALDGQNGGTGWANAWSGGATRNLVNSPGMEYSDGTYNLTTVGGYVGIGGFNDATFRSLSQTYGAPGTTIYVSCLTMAAAAGADYAGLALFLDGDEKFFIGRTFGYFGYFTFSGGGAVSLIDTAAPALLVLRLDFEADYTVARLYVNPPLGAEPSLSSVRGEWRLQPVTFNRVRIAAGNGGTTAMIDEIRLGETYDDVTPDDTPDTPFITVKQVELNEGDSGTTTASVEVRLNEASASTVAVDYTTSNVSANAGNDYVAATDQVTFDPGQTLKQIEITINGDTDVEITEALRVTLSSPVNALLAETSALVIIANDDWAGPDLIFYEGFGGYPTGDLVGQGPPFGGSSTWSGTPTSVFDNITSTYTQDPRSLEVADGTVSLGTRNAANFVGLAESLGADGQTVYISFLRNEFALDWSGVSLYQGGQELLFFGRGFQQSFTGVFSSNGANPGRVELFYEPPTPTPFVNGMFLVYRLDFRTGFVRIRMFRNPDLTLGEPSVSAIGDLIIPFNGTIDQLRLGSGYSGFTGSAEFDEIRIACTWDAAVPVIADLPELSLSGVTVYERNEGQKLLQFSATLSEGSSTDVSVDYSTADSSALAGEDYEAMSGTLVIPAGETEGVIEVPMNGDYSLEPDESFTVNLSNPVEVSLSTVSVIGTILNDDNPEGWVVGHAGRLEGNSGDQKLIVYIGLNSIPTETVSVDYSTVDGTALAGEDYTAASGTITLQPGETWKSVEIMVHGDTLIEPHELFLVRLSNSSGPAIVSGEGLCHVGDDDSPISAGDWTELAKGGEPVPGHDGRFWSGVFNDNLISMNDFGDVAFVAESTDELGTNKETAIWLFMESLFIKVALIDGPAAEPFNELVHASFNDVKVSNARIVAFTSEYGLPTSSQVQSQNILRTNDAQDDSVSDVRWGWEFFTDAFGDGHPNEVGNHVHAGIFGQDDETVIDSNVHANASSFTAVVKLSNGDEILNLPFPTPDARPLSIPVNVRYGIGPKLDVGLQPELVELTGESGANSLNLIIPNANHSFEKNEIVREEDEVDGTRVDAISEAAQGITKVFAIVDENDPSEPGVFTKHLVSGDKDDFEGTAKSTRIPAEYRSPQRLFTTDVHQVFSSQTGPNHLTAVVYYSTESGDYFEAVKEGDADVSKLLGYLIENDYLDFLNETTAGKSVGQSIDMSTGEKRIAFTSGTGKMSNVASIDSSPMDVGSSRGRNIVLFRDGADNRGLGMAAMRDNPPMPMDPEVDFGDAPSSYGVAAHSVPEPKTLYLGGEVDREFVSQHSADAQADDSDATPDDEDGVIFRGPLVAGLVSTVEVTAAATGELDFWIDYNGDGDFDHQPLGGAVNEYAVDNIVGHPGGSYTVAAGPNQIRFLVPNNIVSGVSFARFRLSTGGALPPEDTLPPVAPPVGEVEDYRVQLFDLLPDFGDAPDTVETPRYPTLLANNGAYHLASVEDFFMGAAVDFEDDGKPDPNAAGDDADDGVDPTGNTNPDDEDGITFVTALVPGQASTINVLASVPPALTEGAKLDAWIDLNQDSDWSDAGEQVLSSATILDGNNLIEIQIPAEAVLGQTYARFRISRDGGLAPGGAATSGEVEDYAVELRATSPAVESITIEGEDIVIRWNGSEVLECAPNVTGPWEEVIGAGSPYHINPSDAPARYYRLRID